MSGAGAYLLLYNAVQLIGWSYILVAALLEVPEAIENKDVSNMWHSVRTPMRLFQTLMLMEVLHALFGLVRSSAWNNLLQVGGRCYVMWLIYQQVLDRFGRLIASRVFLVWAVYYYILESKRAIRGTNTPAVCLLIYPWAITEILRYSYYILYVFNAVPYWLTWCRYSFFTILYPLGVAGEVLSIWRAATYLRDTPMFRDLAQFTVAGVKVHMSTLFFASLGLYVIFFPKLYRHMFLQRAKVLGRSSSSTAGGAVSSTSSSDSAVAARARKEKLAKAQ